MRRSTSWFAGLLAAAALCATPTTASAGPTQVEDQPGPCRYSVRTLGLRAKAINDRGVVAGTSAVNHAVRFDPRTKVELDLGTLGGYQSDGSAINSRGQIAGEADLAGGGSHAFLWDPRTRRMADLGTLGGTNSRAFGINDRGQVVGESETSTNATHAFLWEPRTRAMTDLGTLGGDRAQALAINDRGQVVGNAANADGLGHAFLRQPRSSRLVDLGVLPGTLVSSATDINDAGTVVGAASSFGDNTSQAFSWRPGRGMRTIPGLPAGSSEARALNDDGTVVGNVVQAEEHVVAYAWNPRTRTSVVLPPPADAPYEAVAVSSRPTVVGASALWSATCSGRRS